MISNHLILCWPLLLLPSVFPSIRGFSNESALCIRWPKYWSLSFSFSISPSNECLGLVSFRVDWFNLLAVQGMLKRLLQPHSSKASVLQCSAFWGASLVAKTVKNPPAMWDKGHLVVIPGLERSPGGGHGNPIQYSCLENPHGQRSLVGYRPQGHKESNTTERLSTPISSHN